MANKHCKHGHTIETHPNCFRAKQWYEKENKSLLFWDLEVTNLKADSGYVVCWAAKGSDGREFSAQITEADVAERSFDRFIVEQLVDVLTEYDVWVGYYSTFMDLPYSRTRALRWDIPFPYVGEKYHIDLYFHVRNKLQLYRNSLKMATQFFGIQGKTDIDFNELVLAGLGDKEALATMMYHCKKDVLILERLFKKMTPYCKFTKKSI